MDLDNVRGFKKEAGKIIERELLSLINSEVARPWRCPPALGIYIGSTGNYGLAIRLRQKEDMPKKALETLKEIAHKENTDLDLRIIGHVRLLNTSEHDNSGQYKCRPLSIGASIGQLSDSFGTLGCFVRKQGISNKLFLLSNSHVIASPVPHIGQSIIQPGGYHGGTHLDSIGKLDKFIALNSDVYHQADAAIAEIIDGSDVDLSTIDGLGDLQGIQENPYQTGEKVYKLGAATRLTYGKILSFEQEVRIPVDDLPRGLMFENQIEIESSGQQPFADHGDSGSLVINDHGYASGLLFCTSEIGRLSYANPIDSVLNNEQWSLELAIS